MYAPACIKQKVNLLHQVEEHVSQVKAIAKAENSADFDFATDAKEQEALWSARKQALWSMLALKRDGDEAWSTDVAVPFSRLPDLIGICNSSLLYNMNAC